MPPVSAGEVTVLVRRPILITPLLASNGQERERSTPCRWHDWPTDRRRTGGQFRRWKIRQHRNKQHLYAVVCDIPNLGWPLLTSGHHIL